MTPAALAALHARCFTTPRPWSEAEFAGFMADSAMILIAAPDHFALGRTLLDEAELLTLAVAPEARAQGRGQQCLGAFEAAARAQGARSAVLEVADDNAAARALYGRAGYRPMGRRRAYYRTPDGRRIDALVLRKSLLPDF